MDASSSSSAGEGEDVNRNAGIQYPYEVKFGGDRKAFRWYMWLWGIWEEEHEKWIDENLTADVNLDNLNEDIGETAEPSSDLIVPLLRYQKEWLAWALKQEESPNKGGILADEMGMGKTVQAIALVLTKRELNRSIGSGLNLPSTSADPSTGLPEVRATLFVCPLAALSHWGGEIFRFTSAGSTQVLVYHGANRSSSLEQFKEYDFVITTYSLLEADCRKYRKPPRTKCPDCGHLLHRENLYKHYACKPNAVKTAKQSKKQNEKSLDQRKRKSAPATDMISHFIAEQNDRGKSPLHSVRWKRIILDEAHLVKNRRSNTVKAVFALDSLYKWGLSGTLLQNNVDYLYSLSANQGEKGSNDDGSVVDYKGNHPVDKTKTGGWLGAGLILGTELSERICVMGISMNLVTYLVGDLHISSARSATVVTNFMGTLNLLSLLGGFLADAKLGRYLTVSLFATITALGVSLLALATTIPSMRPPPCSDYRKLHHECIEATGSQLVLLYAALYVIALGGGGIKSNVSGFGSDQFDNMYPKEEKAMIFFFNRFYFAISIGSLFAVIVLVYVQDNIGRGWGYGISAGTMVIAVIVLLAGTRLYRFKNPQGSPLTVIWRVAFLAWKKRSSPYPAHRSFLNGFENARVQHTEKFRCLDKAAVLDEADSVKGTEPNPWLVSTVTEVEEVNLVVKLTPIWSTCILFWTIYSQMTTFTIEQATAMNRTIGFFTIPAGSLSAFLFVTILLFTSLNKRVFVPVARKLTHTTQGLTSIQLIGVGLVFSVVAMAASAVVERQRQVVGNEHGTKISAFWLVPQFFLVGAGEAPERMKSMSAGLFLSSISMGFFVSSLLVSLVDKVTNKSWLRSNLNKGRLNNFYWLLAVLGVINFLVFVVFAMRHQYKVQNYLGSGADEEFGIVEDTEGSKEMARIGEEKEEKVIVEEKEGAQFV